MRLSNLERNFLLKALAANNRLDERKPHEFREIAFEFDETQRGLVTVHLGRTKVLAVVTAFLVRPYPDRPSEGVVNYYAQISSTSVPDGSEVKEEEEAKLQRMVERILKNSRFVDTESLCIIPSERVWSIRIDTHAIDYDGNLIDATIAGAVAALIDFRRPDVTTTESGDVVVHDVFEKHPVPLALHNPPIAVSFALVDVERGDALDHATKQNSKIVVAADPLHAEEALGGRYTLAMNRNGEIVAITKSGGEAVDLGLLQDDCLVLARSRTINVLDAIQAKITKIRSTN